jgi:hypothetical protein
MLLHISWIRFYPGVSKERIEKHWSACRSLVGQVPGVLNLQCGANISDQAGGMTHGMVVALPDRASLPAFLEHPAQVPVAAALKGDVAEMKVMDLQV